MQRANYSRVFIVAVLLTLLWCSISVSAVAASPQEELRHQLGDALRVHDSNEACIAGTEVCEGPSTWIVLQISVVKDRLFYPSLAVAVNREDGALKSIVPPNAPTTCFDSVWPLGHGCCLLVETSRMRDAESRRASSNAWMWTIQSNTVKELPRLPQYDPSGIAISSLCQGMARHGFRLKDWVVEEGVNPAQVTFEAIDGDAKSIVIPLRRNVKQYVWSMRDHVAEVYQFTDDVTEPALKGIDWRHNGEATWTLTKGQLEDRTGFGVVMIHKLLGYIGSSESGLLLFRGQDDQGSIWCLDGTKGMLRRAEMPSPVDPIPLYTTADPNGTLVRIAKSNLWGRKWDIIRLLDRRVIQHFETNDDRGPWVECLFEDGFVAIDGDGERIYFQKFNQTSFMTVLNINDYLPKK